MHKGKNMKLRNHYHKEWIEKRIKEQTTHLENGCLVWNGCKAGKYGKMTINRKQEYVHRIVYELNNGNIPEGLLVCHSCDNPLCCNPKHLFLGTYRDNSQDAESKGRLYRNTMVGKNHPKWKQISKELYEKILADTRTISEIGYSLGIDRRIVKQIKKGTRHYDYV